MTHKDYDNLKEGDHLEMEDDWNKTGFYFWTPGTVRFIDYGTSVSKSFEPDHKTFEGKIIFAHRMRYLRIKQ